MDIGLHKLKEVQTMDTYVIAISNKTRYSFFNNLPPFIETENPKANFLIHSDPVFGLNKSKLITNFDFLIDTEIKDFYEDEIFIRSILGNRYINLNIKSKYVQIPNLNQLVTKLNLDIIIPNTFTINDNNKTTKTCNYDFTSLGSKKLVIKRYNGARGTDQILVDVDQVNNLLAKLYLYPLAELKTRFPEAIFTKLQSEEIDYQPRFEVEDSESCKKNKKVFFPGCDELLIQEYINNVDKEFRIIISGKELFIIERSINDNEYRQANLDLNTAVYTKPKPLIDKSILPTDVIKLIEKLDLKLASIDVFVTKDQNWGVFEYSHEFGMTSFSEKTKTDILNSFLSYIVENYKSTAI